MKRKYRIIIFTTEGVIDRKFYKKEIAIRTIIKFKEYFDDFKIGLLQKKIEGEWTTVSWIKK